jgi:CBS domain-containing protein
MSSPVVVVDPDSSVSYAMTLMRRRNIHSVVVDISEKNPSYGIVTTTDVRDKIVLKDAILPKPLSARSCQAPLLLAAPIGP